LPKNELPPVVKLAESDYGQATLTLTMKTTHSLSLKSLYKALIAFGVIGLLAVAGISSEVVMPGSFQAANFAPAILIIVSIGSAAFVWSIFRLIRPVRANRGWQIAEMVLVPLYWLVLLLAADVLLGRLFRDSIQEMQNFVIPLFSA
jgi:hypothetical protein